MIQLSAFREAPAPDGKPGPFSLRRILAAGLAASGVALLFLGLLRPPAGGAWAPVLPGAICIVAALVLVICTTAGDIAQLFQAAKGAAKSAGPGSIDP